MADEESQVSPLAPAQIYQKSDENYLAPINLNKKPHQRSNKCLVYILAAVVLQGTVMLIFASIVFRIKSPDVKLRSVAITNLQYNSTVQLPLLNMTLVAEVTVDNENFGRFKFVNSKASVLYGTVIIGDANIYGGGVRARETKVVGVNVEVRSNGLGDNMNFSRDMRSELVKLSSYAKLSGKVHVLRMVKKHKTAEMNCTMNLNLTSRAIQDLVCN